MRFAALHAGCPHRQLHRVEAYASDLIDQGNTAHTVITAARSFAAQVIEQVPA